MQFGESPYHFCNLHLCFLLALHFWSRREFSVLFSLFSRKVHSPAELPKELHAIFFSFFWFFLNFSCIAFFRCLVGYISPWWKIFAPPHIFPFFFEEIGLILVLVLPRWNHTRSTSPPNQAFLMGLLFFFKTILFSHCPKQWSWSPYYCDLF